MARAKSTHDELDALREQAAGERVKGRDIEAQLEAAEDAAEQSNQAVIEALAGDGDVRSTRKEQERAAVLVHELEQQRAAAQLRVERAQQKVDAFANDHATKLLAERVAEAETVTAQLNASVAETLKLHRQLLDERQSMDRTISAGGGEPRHDGAPPSHAWEAALNDLARVVQQNPQLEPLAPRWHGRAMAQERDRLHGMLRAQRA